VPAASLPGDAGGTLIEGTSWTSTTVATGAAGLSITGAGATFSGLAGLQVVPLPEPTIVAGLSSGTLLLGVLARRKGVFARRRGLRT
jgi:hypothetical protein